MTEQQVRQLLEQTGAILQGHFLLTSGRHGSTYVEKFQVLQHPRHTEALAAALAERFAGDHVQVVVGPAMGGVLLAHEVGKKLGTRALFTERENGVMTLRRGFTIEPGERVVVVEDIVTTGGSVKEVLDVVAKAGGVIVGAGLLVDRSGGSLDLGVRTEALLHLTSENFPTQTYEPSACPLCAQGVPLTKRGSRKL
ncbi:MAG: orotate phosphoribosyltransferase [Sporomusaceae bacterium]|nr:orotate phosphoribosyltransferase [Sporomusaceae bacterium]